VASLGEQDPVSRALSDLSGAVLPHGRHLTAEEVAAESGVDLEMARRLRRAMGLPDVPPGEPAFFEQDLEALRRTRALVDEDGLTPAEVLHMARTLGLAAARMADAVVGFWADRAAGASAIDGSAVESAQVGSVFEPERIDQLERVVGYLFRRHLLDSVSRRIGSADTSPSPAGPVVAVGFADLVGFTSLSEQLNDTETAELIERFEVLATDSVVGGGGRVIKMIGDEVMFSSEPKKVAEIALSLSETFDSPDLPAVRVGVASGHVVSQAGDLYGPVVNLASRATMAAHPGSVLISGPLADNLEGEEEYSVRPLKLRRLKGIGPTQLFVLRRSAQGASTGHRSTD
jgi:adenylate cyclase